MTNLQRYGISTLGCVAAVLSAAGLVHADLIVDENFDAVTGTGGGVFVTAGTGFNTVADWDTGIEGEGAFAGGTGFAVLGEAAAYGDPTGGVDGTGAGVISVTGVEFNSVGENFEAATGVGGGEFVTTPSGDNVSENWDDGIDGETAQAGALNGASVGSAVAEAVLGAGVDGSNAGRLTVQNVNLGGSGDWYGSMRWTTPLPTGKPVNTSFENIVDGERPEGFFYWGNAWSVAEDVPNGVVPHTGSRLLKMWGNWSGNWNTSAVGQAFPSQEGDVWEGSCWVKQISGDNIVGTGNFVLFQMEFMDANDERIDVNEPTVLDTNTPVDAWTFMGPYQATAPAGTVSARIVVMFLQPNYEGGAAQVDDISFERISGPPALDVSNLYLAADVQGAAVSGQSLGDYVLRLEDADGDALEFSQTANGAYQTIGGVVGDGMIATPTGQHPDADGLFDYDSSAYFASVGFKNPAATWGTGGVLTVDNLVLSTGDSADSSWYAGLYWENLPAPTITDLSQLLVSADVKGDVPGGNYQLRVETYRQQPVANVDQDFSTATGTGGGWFLDGDSTDTTFYTTNYDDGITGEAAFGGIYGDNTEICTPDICTSSGFKVEVLPTGGVDGGAAARYSVEYIIFGVDEGWYGGLNWGNQVLPPEPDLSQITLTADVLGEAMEGGGYYGDYELRIEDGQGDRLYFRTTADGTWQHLGGPLSTATEAAAADGGGDGTFDLDANAYTVTIAFVDEALTWAFGGSLTVDNVFLTSGSVRREIGRVVFHETADGTFQTIGGMLADGEQPENMELSEDFNNAVGNLGGEYFNTNGGGYLASFDSGVPNAEAFAGTWGDVGMTSTSGMAVGTCPTCGVDGTPGAYIDTYGITPGADSSAGWYNGISFIDSHAVVSDLTAVSLYADVKAEVDEGAGEMYGIIAVRIEDPEQDFLAFEVTADGTWQHIGGMLSDAISGSNGDGNGVVDADAEWYHIVVTFTGRDVDWGTGGTLYVDNVVLDGITLADAEEYTAVVTFENEVDSWGTSGTLTVDNLLFTSAGSADFDLDGDVDLKDFAAFQACYGDVPSGVCALADLDGDGDVDINDHRLLTTQFVGP